jgi:hypothetical protein
MKIDTEIIKIFIKNGFNLFEKSYEENLKKMAKCSSYPLWTIVCVKCQL